jgi:phosphoribosyl-ATP pyrophosphohydrolase
MAPSADADAAPTSSAILDRLYAVIASRRDERPTGSYVVRLLDGGAEAIGAKVLEEAQEVVDAARDESDEALAAEVADLVFHSWVALASRGVEPDRVYRVLAKRFGTGGLEEKANRSASAAAKEGQ